MIEYSYDEEKIVALYFAELLNDSAANSIIQNGVVSSSKEATHLSKFFWNMVNKSAEGNITLECEGSSEYWTEKLYNSFGGYLEKNGYSKEWDTEVDNA